MACCRLAWLCLTVHCTVSLSSILGQNYNTSTQYASPSLQTGQCSKTKIAKLRLHTLLLPPAGQLPVQLRACSQRTAHRQKHEIQAPVENGLASQAAANPASRSPSRPWKMHGTNCQPASTQHNCSETTCPEQPAVGCLPRAPGRARHCRPASCTSGYCSAMGASAWPPARRPPAAPRSCPCRRKRSSFQATAWLMPAQQPRRWHPGT